MCTTHCNFMALISCFQVLLLALICFLFLYYLRNNNGSPKSSPAVGLLELLRNIHRFHDWCTETLERCNGTFVLEGPRFAKLNWLMTCDPTNIHYVMSSNFTNFPKGPEFKQMFDALGDGIFNSDMDLWRNQRKAAQGFMKCKLFHQFLLRTTRDKMEKGLIPVLEHVAKQGLVVNLEDVFQRFTFDSTCILVTGYDPGCLSVEFPRVLFSEAVDDGQQAVFYRHVRPQSFVKLQKWLNVGQEGKHNKAIEVIDGIIAKYVCQKRKDVSKLNQEPESEDGVDLLTSYITEEKSTSLKCDDKFLRDTFFNMILAGRDTTSAALTWFIWLVSRHPVVENRIIQELESRIPVEETKRRRLFTTEEVKNLVYLHAALCESLRLYPPVPFNHKEPLEPDTLPSGHRVHPKMKILFNLYSMGRMESIWGKDCCEFKPERWIDERGGIKHEPSYKFVSFGAGPRICLGKEVAFVQMKAVASAMIYNYRIHILDETSVVPAMSIILHTKDGLMTRVSTRWD
ncbi:cytochrome P450, family 96, subfamily A, polypeptide 10 [Hibiscus trionum]|uniref:Cytochrome P450, family 96, subfamily A, polypeptide 10 n=1 Tax=Hibiscus trionum TaxID=183268 RepID=A0A9W7IX55_HIBTR|nr:cytochrome P450, family 96, subfamily A, polypeptide 10 [Hibiscus trionum]